jgi:hypothetical protein
VTKLALAAAIAFGCSAQTSTGPAQSPKLAPDADGQRLGAQGVAAPKVDLAAAQPPALERAQRGASVAVLSTPRDPAALEHLVQAFFRAVSRESSAELSALVREDATTSSASDPQSPALLTWNRRFAALDYSGLDAALIARHSALKVYAAEDVARLGRPPTLRLKPSNDFERLLTIPVNSSSELSKLFGPEIQLLVSWEGERPQIIGFYEEFRLR